MNSRRNQKAQKACHLNRSLSVKSGIVRGIIPHRSHLQHEVLDTGYRHGDVGFTEPDQEVLEQTNRGLVTLHRAAGIGYSCMIKV